MSAAGWLEVGKVCRGDFRAGELVRFRLGVYNVISAAIFPHSFSLIKLVNYVLYLNGMV